MLQQVYNKSFGLDTLGVVVVEVWHRPTIVLLLVYCSVDNTLFEVSPEIRCSGMSSRYVVMETTQLVLSQLKKLFILSIENWLRSLSLSLPQIISKCCELVKLCDINRCGADFLRHGVDCSCRYARPTYSIARQSNGVVWKANGYMVIGAQTKSARPKGIGGAFQKTLNVKLR